MRVLVTRPEVDAAPLVAALEGLGHQASLQPLLTILPVEPPPEINLDGIQAILFTSANGVRTLAHLTAERDLPVFSVGDASAAEARSLGFSQVHSAGGAVDDLAELVIASLEPGGGALFHGAGASLAGDLKGALEDAAFTVRRAVLYRTEAVQRFSGDVQSALSAGSIGVVLLFSPRSAETFVVLTRAAGLEPALQSCYGLCLSAAVAEKIKVLPWREIKVAARPDQESLLACLESLT